MRKKDAPDDNREVIHRGMFGYLTQFSVRRILPSTLTSAQNKFVASLCL